jgi:hypothetical protein
MQVNLDIADIVIKHNLNKAKNSLENAKKDGTEATIFLATQSLFHIHQDQTDRKRSYWSNDSRWDPLSVWHKLEC